MEISNQKKTSKRKPRPSDVDVRELIELSYDLYVVAGVDGYFKLVNQSWVDTLGWSKEELYDRPYIDFVHPDDRLATKTEHQRVATCDGGKSHFTNRYLCKDGTYKWLLWSSYEKDKLIYAVARDVTPLKQQELVLRETSQLAQIGGWTIDVDTETVTCAEQTYSMLEIPQGKVLTAEECFQRFMEPSQSIFRRAARNARMDAKPYDLELEFASLSGQARWIRVIGKPEIKDGRVYRVVGLCQDITERKLERISAMQAAKMASLGEMAGGIAHEINNPLAIIAMRTRHVKHLLERGAQNIPTALELLSVMDDTVERIASIIRGLRFFARIGDQDPFEEVSMANIFKDTVPLCRDRLVAAQVELAIEPGPLDTRVECRPVQISQIILNLLNNAIHAATHGPEPRWIRVLVEHDDTMLRVKISNSGAKIPEDIRNRIMEPFFTTKKLGEGTGLGLSISKGIAEEHGGRLYLDDENPNTCFVLELALRRRTLG